nr:hypothetical protein [Nonomuraea aridisoli]
MPRPRSSPAHDRANERTAAFDAEYTLSPACPLLDAIDVTSTIEAPSFRYGSASRRVNTVPFTLIAKIRSRCSSVTSSSAANSPAPALATRASTRLPSAATLAYTSAMSRCLVTSPRRPTAPWPISATAASSSACLRPVM